MKDPSKILIVKLSAIGDVVHSIPLLEVLKENFPVARIDWLVENRASQIIEGHPAINRVIISRRKDWWKRISGLTGVFSTIGEIVRFVRKVREYRYDIIIDLQGLLKSGLLIGMSRGSRKIGMSGAREGAWLFIKEKSIEVNYDQHAIDRYLQVAKHLNCNTFLWKGSVPISEADKVSINELINTNEINDRPIVAINPIARWKTKLWYPDRFAELAERIQQSLNCQVVFTGSKNDRDVINGIFANIKNKPINLAGRTKLKELAYFYSKCAALVTTDTGPMHIAAAMECRVVALFGPTSPLRTGPYGEGHKVIRDEVACGPCFKKKCEDVVCMKNISVDSVFEATKEIVGQKRESSESSGEIFTRG